MKRLTFFPQIATIQDIRAGQPQIRLTSTGKQHLQRSGMDQSYQITSIKHPIGVLGTIAYLRHTRLREVIVGSDHIVLISGDSPHTISFNDLKQVSLTKGRLFASLAIDAKPRPWLFHGLRKSSAEEIVFAIDQQKRVWRRNWWNAAAEEHYLTLANLKTQYENYIAAERYIGKREAGAWTVDCRKAISPYAKVDIDTPESGLEWFIEVVQFLRDNVSKIEDRRREANWRYVQHELGKCKQLFDSVEGHKLTEEQRLAIVTDESVNLVVSAAGSGKTTAIVGKYLWLTKTGYREPKEVLVLVYGKRARVEMRERIKRLSGPGDEMLPAVATLPSLAYSIVSDVEGEKPQLDDAAIDKQVLLELIAEIVVNLMNDKTFTQAAVRWFQEHFAPYRSEYEFDDQGSYWGYIRENEIRSLKGDLVKSFDECQVANTLYLNGIPYEYEAPYRHRDATPEECRYRSSFYLPRHDVYIDCLVLEVNGDTPPFLDSRKYQEDLEWRRDLHYRCGTKFVETFSWWQSEGMFAERLEEVLTRVGVKFSPLPSRMTIEKLHKSEALNSLASLIAEFLKHFKDQGMIEDDLQNTKGRGPEARRCDAFVEIFLPVYRKYQEELRRRRKLDLFDILRRAAELVETEKYSSPYQYILVDDLQDVSTAENRLLKALLGSQAEADDCHLFAVGDDWQSVVRNSGVDMSVMLNFAAEFGETEKMELATTFRCPAGLINVVRKFILENPKQVAMDMLPVPDGSDETAVHLCMIDKAESKSMVVDVMSELSDKESECQDKASVLLLGRHGPLEPGFLSQLEKRFERLELTSMTVHESKGQEADYVIVSGMKAGLSGFPASRECDPIQDMVLSQQEQFPHAEERRLFYLALTRARKGVYLMSDRDWRSAFAEELASGGYDVQVRGVEPADERRCPDCVTGRMRRQWNKASGGRMFIGCTNFPYCGYSEEVCTSCHRGQLVWKGGWATVCNSCGEEFESCPKQGCWGWLVEHHDKDSRPILRCSEFRKGCNYTRSVRPRSRT